MADPTDTATIAPIDQRLMAAVEGDRLVISIGVATLAHAFLHAPAAWELFDQSGEATVNPAEVCKVTDLHGFARDVAEQLVENGMEEDGSTTLTTLLDAACLSVVGDGSEHFQMPDDEED